MKFLKKSHAFHAALCGIALAAATEANAQVRNINSIVVQTNVVTTTNFPTAVLTVVSNYPSLVSFSVTNAGTTNTAFSAMQDVWQFSTNKTSPYMFQTNDYFTAYMTVTLTGNPVSPRKEAGFAFNDVAGSISGQYILDTDAGEVVAFGGNIPFYASPLDHSYVSGTPITMGVTIFKDANGSNAIVYSANGISSPVLEFGNPGGVNAVNVTGGNPAPYSLGGYFQIQGQASATTNNGSAVFQNINILTQPNLNIAQNGNQSVVYWDSASANFRLQTSTNLASTNWTSPSTNGAFVIGVVVTNSNPASFYRLITP
jgi:hypothetical protein